MTAGTGQGGGPSPQPGPTSSTSASDPAPVRRRPHPCGAGQTQVSKVRPLGQEAGSSHSHLLQTSWPNRGRPSPPRQTGASSASRRAAADAAGWGRCRHLRDREWEGGSQSKPGEGSQPCERSHLPRGQRGGPRRQPGSDLHSTWARTEGTRAHAWAEGGVHCPLCPVVRRELQPAGRDSVRILLKARTRGQGWGGPREHCQRQPQAPQLWAHPSSV